MESLAHQLNTMNERIGSVERRLNERLHDFRAWLHATTGLAGAQPAVPVALAIAMSRVSRSVTFMNPKVEDEREIRVNRGAWLPSSREFLDDKQENELLSADFEVRGHGPRDELRQEPADLDHQPLGWRDDRSRQHGPGNDQALGARQPGRCAVKPRHNILGHRPFW